MGRGGAAGAFDLSGSPQPAAAGETPLFRKVAYRGDEARIGVVAAVGGAGAVGTTSGAQPISSGALSTLGR